MAEDKKIDSAQKEILVIDIIKRQLIRGLLVYMLLTNVFIFLRMVLRLLGADPENFFAGFIFLVSGFFLLPFYDIFPQFKDPIVAGKMTVDVSAFISLFCINVLTLLAMSVITVVTRMIKTRKQAKETIETSKPVDAIQAEESVE